jgi:hypothetical protein
MTKHARFCAADDCTNDVLDDGHCAIHGAALDHPAIARLLTAQETARRRSERAASNGPAIVTLCAEPGCPRAAAHGPWCGEHRPIRRAFEPTTTVAFDLDRDQIAALRQQVEADAAPIFVIAMNWIARQRVAHLGVSLDSLEASMTRIRAELGAPT